MANHTNHALSKPGNRAGQLIMEWAADDPARLHQVACYATISRHALMRRIRETAPSQITLEHADMVFDALVFLGGPEITWEWLQAIEQQP